MRWVSDDGAQRVETLAAVAGRTLIGLDFDGTLAPIVADPTTATVHHEIPAVLAELADLVGEVAIVTGRPVRHVLGVGGIEALADHFEAAGTELFIFGHYGAESWSSSTREVSGAPEPAGLATFRAGLDALIAQAGVTEVFVEDKGLGLALHTRRSPDPHGDLERLRPLVARSAQACGLHVEPGRLVLEVRGDGWHKGVVIEELIETLEPRGVVFIGDDRGDVPAFEMVAAKRGPALAGLLVCSGSDEESVLTDLADAVVDGPDGVVDFLRRLASEFARQVG